MRWEVVSHPLRGCRPSGSGGAPPPTVSPRCSTRGCRCPSAAFPGKRSGAGVRSAGGCAEFPEGSREVGGGHRGRSRGGALLPLSPFLAAELRHALGQGAQRGSGGDRGQRNGAVGRSESAVRVVCRHCAWSCPISEPKSLPAGAAEIAEHIKTATLDPDHPQPEGWFRGRDWEVIR